MLLGAEQTQAFTHALSISLCSSALALQKVVINCRSLQWLFWGHRFDKWGSLRATYIHFRIGLEWYLGKSPEELERVVRKLYTDIR